MDFRRGKSTPIHHSFLHPAGAKKLTEWTTKVPSVHTWATVPHLVTAAWTHL